MDSGTNPFGNHLIESDTQVIEGSTILPEALPPTAPRDPQSMTIIVPVFNEHENFPKLLKAIETHVEAPYTVLVVYDFDRDTTIPVVRQLAKSRPWLKLIKNTLGRGPANALRAGFRAVKSGPVLVVMADLSDDLRDVVEMRRLYAEGHRIVCASRYARGGRQLGGPLLKRTLSRLAGLSLRYLARFPIHDATNNFRLYDAALVNELGIDSTHGFEVALELTAKAFARGATIAEVPTTWTDRTAGKSRFRMSRWLPKYVHWYLYAFRHGWSRRRHRP